MFGEKNVIFDNIPTTKQIINEVYNIYKKYWKTSYDYTKVKPNFFSSKPLKNFYKKDIEFMKNIFYINHIGEGLLNENLYDEDKLLLNELTTTEQMGCLCIYTTVLLYCLLDKCGYIDKNKCFLTQGFYRYQLRNDFPSFLINAFSKLQTGLHAFLNFNGSVIDLTLYPQQRTTFDFKKTTMIIGRIPSGMQLVGFNETHELIIQYAKQFAGINNLSIDDWIQYHKLNVDVFIMKKQLKYLQSKLQTEDNNEQ